MNDALRLSQLIEDLKGIEKFLKVPLRGTFKNFSGFLAIL